MTPLSNNSLCSVLFEMNWQHNGIKHKETYFARKVNLWRDTFPPGIKESLLDMPVGEKVNHELKPGLGDIPEHDQHLVKQLKRKQFNGRLPDNTWLEPRYGRYYPKGRLRDQPNIFRSNITPFRVVDLDESTLHADLNHPMAGKPVETTLQVVKVMDKIDERGGTCMDWVRTIIDGPGMQARVNGRPTQFLAGNALERQDSAQDILFYTKPRLVTHIDDTAIQTVTDIYERLIPADAHVLDLMSSWKSHLPKDGAYKNVTGLGMNLQELEKNIQLTDFLVHDLNKNPTLPFDNAQYNAAVCTVSVEYLTQPLDVFKQVARVLKPGGVFIVTFSNRWFPPKVVNIWKEIHEFERLGLVTEYFLDSGMFDNIHTISVRGLNRPADDKYYKDLEFSDPVYGVYGYTT